jgi:hypothetical protein
MTVKDKNKLSKEICDDFCNIMKIISTKATQVDISKEGHGLSGNFVNEDLTQEEMGLQALEQYGESIGLLDEAILRKLRHFSVALRWRK